MGTTTPPPANSNARAAAWWSQRTGCWGAIALTVTGTASPSVPPLRAAADFQKPEQGKIGPPGIASPPGWTETTHRRVAELSRLPVRVRAHPGEKPCTPIREDLEHAAAVVTWGSGSAIVALEMGIPVFYCLPTWIAREAATMWAGREGQLEHPKLDEEDRFDAFRKIGRATWRTDELETGEPFARLLGR